MDTQSSTRISRTPSQDDSLDIVNLDVEIDFHVEPPQPAALEDSQRATSAFVRVPTAGQRPPLPIPRSAADAKRGAETKSASATPTPQTRSPQTQSPRTQSPRTQSPSLKGQTTRAAEVKVKPPAAPATDSSTKPSATRHERVSASSSSSTSAPSKRRPEGPVAIDSAASTPPPPLAVEPSETNRTASVTWVEATKALRVTQADAWRVRTTVSTFERVSAEGLRKGGLFSRCWSCFHYDISEGTPQWDERDFLLALASTPVCYETNTVHKQMLMSVWLLLQGQYYAAREANLTNAEGVVALPLRSLQWVLLGFSDADPTADFRHVGVFGLYQLLFLSQHRSQLVNALFRLSRSKTHRFPLGQVAMAFSMAVLQLLKDRDLNPLIRDASETSDPRNAVLSSYVKGSVDVTSVVNAVYTGLWFRFHELWSPIAQRQPTDSVTPILKTLMRDIRKSVKELAELDHSASEFLKVHRHGPAASKPEGPSADGKSPKRNFYALS